MRFETLFVAPRPDRATAHLLGGSSSYYVVQCSGQSATVFYASDRTARLYELASPLAVRAILAAALFPNKYAEVRTP